MRRSLGWTAVAVSLLFATGQTVGAQEPPPEYRVFGHTLHQGSGFIATPHAFVNEGTFFASGTLVGATDFDPADPETFTRGAVAIALGRLIELGGTIHARDAFSGFFKLQLVRQTGAFPAIAFGGQNLSGAAIGRFGFNPDPGGEQRHAAGAAGVGRLRPQRGRHRLAGRPRADGGHPLRRRGGRAGPD